MMPLLLMLKSVSAFDADAVLAHMEVGRLVPM